MGPRCTDRIHIRTRNPFFDGILQVVERDLGGSVMIIVGYFHFVVIEEDRVHKGVDQHFSMRLLFHVQFPEPVKPECQEFFADPGLCQLFAGDFVFQVVPRRLQFFQPFFGGTGQDTLCYHLLSSSFTVYRDPFLFPSNTSRPSFTSFCSSRYACGGVTWSSSITSFRVIDSFFSASFMISSL